MIDKNKLAELGERVFHPQFAVEAITANRIFLISWGASDFDVVGVESDGWCKGLLFKVNGYKWKQYVLITLSFMDWYQVRLINKEGEVVKFIDDIFCGDLCEIIHRLVESGT